MAIVSVTMELALEEVPIYAGGLGVLEGDKFRHMSRLGKEYYVITLFHRNGYVDYQYSGGEFVPVGQGEILSRAEEILEREEELVVSSKIVGEVRITPLSLSRGSAKAVYLKPTSPEPLASSVRTLYVEDSPEQSLIKYIVLGRGASQYVKERIGFGKVEAVDLQESMAALAALDLKEILDKVRLVIHTPGPWGHPMIPADVLSQEYGMYGGGGVVRITDVILEIVSRAFGVSRRHWEVLGKLFPRHLGKILYITNGVDLERWSHPEILRLVESKGVRRIGAEDLARARLRAREDLVSLLRSVKPGVKVGDAIVAWARRITRYKRPYMVERLVREMAKESEITFVLAGKAHPKDLDGVEAMKRLRRLHDEYDNVVYIHSYTLAEARTILSGSDLLLFTPFPGWEACGTSYMKAGINGVPTLSSKDGGALEMIIDRYNGWFFGSEVQDLVNIYEEREKVEDIDSRDYKDLKEKLSMILSLRADDPEEYEHIPLNALKSFRVSADIGRALSQYYS